MAWQFSLNNLVSGGNQMINTWMKQLVALGFSCVGSGDGVGGTFENLGQTAGPYDIWTLDGAGPGSYTAGHAGNDNSWYRLRFPDGVRELVVQRYGQYTSGRDDEWKMYYSKTGFLGNDAAEDLPPTAPAADEVMLFGADSSRGGTIGYGGFGLQTGQQGYVQIAAEDAPLNGFYAFYLTSHLQSTGVPQYHVLFEALNDVVAGDPEPYTVHATRHSFLGTGWSADSLGRNKANAEVPGAWINGVWENVALLHYRAFNTSGSNEQVVPKNQAINPADSIERLHPIICGGLDGYKGVCANVKWTPTAGRAYPDTFDSQNFLICEDLALPWDGSTAPLT